MNTQISVTDAIERAKRVQEQRLSTIQAAAEARQNLNEAVSLAERKRAALEEELAESLRSAESKDLAAFNAAVQVGWSVRELREIGLAEPAKKQRVQRRTTKRKSVAPAAKPVTGSISVAAAGTATTVTSSDD